MPGNLGRKWFASTSSSDLCPLFPLQVGGRGWDSKVLESCSVYLNLSPYSKATTWFLSPLSYCWESLHHWNPTHSISVMWEHGGRLWKEYPSHGGTPSSDRMEKQLRGRKLLVTASFQRVAVENSWVSPPTDVGTVLLFTLVYSVAV